MKRTTKKRFKWLLSGKHEKLRKRLEESRNEFFKSMEDEHTRNY